MLPANNKQKVISMEFFDTHAHFYAPDDGDFAPWFQRAAEAGVTRVLLATSGWENTTDSANCANATKGAYFSAGIHPHEAETETSHDLRDYLTFLKQEKCVAAGEIGLDYYYEISGAEKQREVFETFLNLALECDKPAIIHCRDKADSGPAYDHAYEHLSAFAAKGGRFVLHSFAGSPQWVEKFDQLGAWFGVGGMVTFKAAENIRTIVRLMPTDRILMETDSPYLAPVPFRGKRNHPALMPNITETLALCQCRTAEEMAAIALDNALRFFRITKD